MRATGNKMFVSVSVVRGKNSSLCASAPLREEFPNQTSARGITESKQGGK